jgi:hypothetical protein
MSAGPWAAEEVIRLEMLIQGGHSLTRIAKDLDRNLYGIYRYCSDRGLSIRELRRRAQVWTVADVARLFGVSRQAALPWVRRKWLRTTQNRAKAAVQRPRTRRVERLVTASAVDAFICNRETWPAWSVARMTDPDWRTYAADVRAAAGGEWLTTAQVAARWNYSASTIQGWCWDGTFDGVTKTKYNNTWYLWSTDIQSARRAA